MRNNHNSSEQRPTFDGGEARGLFTRTEKFGECGDVVLKSGSRVKSLRVSLKHFFMLFLKYDTNEQGSTFFTAYASEIFK